MKKPPKETQSAIPQASYLRQKAEDALRKMRPGKTPAAPEDAQRLLHELEVHQIELEMQNEELRQAQYELEDSRARYFDLYDLAPVGYVTLSEQGLINEANLTAATMLNVPRGSLSLQPLSRYILSDDADSFYLHRKKLFETGEPQICELRMLRQGADCFWARVEATVAQDAKTGARLCRAVVSDITAHKNEQEALHRSEARFRSYFNLPLIGIAITSLGPYWLEVNDRLCSILGYTRDEILGRTWTDMTHPDDLEADLEPFNRVVSGQIEQYAIEKRFIRKNGTSIWTSFGVGCVRKSDRSVDYFIALVADISERKQAEQALLEKNEDLERFTRAVTHDLKTPLVTISTYLGHLAEDMAAGNRERITQDFSYMRGAAEKMRTLLDELLKVARIGRVTNPSAEALLQDIVQEALALVAGRIDEHGAGIVVSPEPVMLYGDRIRLVEVFQNLIDNAVKFMGEQKAPLIEIGFEIKNSETQFFVRDNGMGFDTRHTGKLFGLFEKLDPEAEGTGIGLALVKRIVEVHGGSIWAESDGPGKGACFWFTLPKKGVQG